MEFSLGRIALFCVLHLIYFSVQESVDDICSEKPSWNALFECCKSVLEMTELQDCIGIVKENQTLISQPLEAVYCAVECAFENRKFLSGPYNLNKKYVKRQLSRKYPHDKAYVKTLMNVVTECNHKIVGYIANEYDKEAKTGCNVYPGLLDACVHIKISRNCPSKYWTSGSNCTNLHRYVKDCVTKI